MMIFKKRFIFFVFVFVITFFITGNQVGAADIVYEGTEVPHIQGRSSWENTGNLRNLLKIKDPKTEDRAMPAYYNPSKMVIHNYNCATHQTNGDRNMDCNSDEQDAISIIQNIYRYHALNRKLGDIGYNFIISWTGEIFEGRYGGNGIVGSHLEPSENCTDYNAGTIGILLLGNIDEEDAPEAMRKSLARLVAWLSMGNNISPANLSKTTKIWQYDSLKSISGELRCDTEKGAFLIDWKSPTISYYGDVEVFTGNHRLNLDDIRVQAIRYKKTFQKYSYRTKEGNDIWTIGDNKRAPNAKLGSKTVTINNSQLMYFPKSRQSTVKDGDVFVIEGRSNPYLLEDGKCYEVVSRNIFNAWDLGNTKQKTVSAHNIPSCIFGEYLSYPEGQLIRSDDSDKVYLVNEDGSISHVSSLLAFEKVGFDWADVFIVSKQEIAVLNEGYPVLLPAGTLVRSDESIVYLISGRAKKPINNSTLFLLNGFDEDDIEIILATELDYYSLGGSVLYPDNTLVIINGDTYIILRGRRHPIVSSMLSHVDKVNREPIVLPEIEKHTYPLGVEVREMADIVKLKNLADSSKEDFVSAYADVPVGGLMRSIRVGITKLDGNEVVKFSADQTYNVQAGQSGAINKIAEEEYSVLPKRISSALRLSSISGNITFNILHKSEVYKLTGNIEIIPVKSGELTEYWLINELLLEDYLLGLSPISGIDEMNALKAMAIASRSYALHYVELGGRYKDLPFHVMAREHEMFFDSLRVDEKNDDYLRAVDETRGTILFHKKKPVLAIYTEDTCGVSKSAKQVFGNFYKKFSYLSGGIHDPVDTQHSVDCPNSAGYAVGMSLVGAQSLASKKDNYVEILKYYYPATNINKIY